ncbi:MAG: hypothetical protein L0I76_15455 [Pseudonocardia sp.]|nr:hypothetical protein [Pseudonocardia sp.]
MSQLGHPVGAALAFVWLGMVLAVSVLEAPLKFRAPGVTLALGLGIGRLVFRALNIVEVVLAAVITVFCAAAPSTTVWVWALLGGLWLVLALQLLALRPRLNRRTDLVISGADVPSSSQHLVYIALEAVKIVLLAVVGVVLIASIP